MSRTRPAASFMASRCFGEVPVTVRCGELYSVRGFASLSRGMAAVAASSSQSSSSPRSRATCRTAARNARCPDSIRASSSSVVRPRSNAMLIAAPPIT